MMSALLARAEAMARTAQLRRLERIAAAVRSAGLAAEIELDTVVIRGRRLVQQWLGDPLLRFIGRNGS
jgi:hypothetical protein